MTRIKFEQLNVSKAPSKVWPSFCSDGVTDRIAQTELQLDPWPHLWVDNVFSPAQYQQLLSLAIEDQYLQTLDQLRRTNPGSYPNRLVMPLKDHMPILPDPQRDLWQHMNNFMIQSVVPVVANRFDLQIKSRFPKPYRGRAECLYIRDSQGYWLGPHTDSPVKVLTIILYLAPLEQTQQLPGTSLYQPLDPEFECPGGPHYSYKKFRRCKTMPYQANSLFAFAKSNSSFHGVEPMTVSGRRDLLICDLQVADR